METMTITGIIENHENKRIMRETKIETTEAELERLRQQLEKQTGRKIDFRKQINSKNT
jgi:phage shock protein A